MLKGRSNCPASDSSTHGVSTPHGGPAAASAADALGGRTISPFFPTQRIG